MNAQSLGLRHSVTLVAPPVALPAPEVEVAHWDTPFVNVRPLWRHVVAVTMIFALSVAWVEVRLDVKKTRIELDRNASMQREALVLNKRLRLEVDARRRAAAMEQVGRALSLSGAAPVVVVARR